MTKASRSRRAQPAFDPSELEDLILTPAVGSGVGSHLVNLSGAPPAPPEAAAPVHLTTVDRPEPATVVEAPKAAEAAAARPVALWLTEAGEPIPAARVQPIRSAGDVLNSAEGSVYSILWGAAEEEAGGSGDAFRVTQAGYDALMKRSRLSKKTIQRTVDRLIDKGFLEIHTPADIYRRTSTVYRVYSFGAVLERQAARGRTHMAKIGPGFVYVRRFAD